MPRRCALVELDSLGDSAELKSRAVSTVARFRLWVSLAAWASFTEDCEGSFFVSVACCLFLEWSGNRTQAADFRGVRLGALCSVGSRQQTWKL